MPRRGSTVSRGYGREHQRERERWASVVASGEGYCQAEVCLMPSRLIHPDESWDLGHLPDRSGWRGPEHGRCNRSDGASRGNRSRVGRVPRVRRLRAQVITDVVDL